MSLTYFPQITSGILTQRPYNTEAAFLHSMNDMPSGTRFGYSWRTKPLMKFNVNFVAITDDECDTLETFFNAQGGRFAEFVFLDPGGNLVHTSETFVSGATDPFGGTRAGATASLTDQVIVSDGTGLILCTSIWVKPASANQTYTIGITGDTTTITTKTTKWQRIHHTGTVASGSAVNALFSGPSTTCYGWQCAPLRAPGSYSRTTGIGSSGCGYHEHSRFDTDTFSRRYIGPNQNAVSLPIVEVGFC